MYLTKVKGASFHYYFSYYFRFITIHNIGSTSSWSQSPFETGNLVHFETSWVEMNATNRLISAFMCFTDVTIVSAGFSSMILLYRLQGLIMFQFSAINLINNRCESVNDSSPIKYFTSHFHNSYHPSNIPAILFSSWKWWTWKWSISGWMDDLSAYQVRESTMKLLLAFEFTVVLHLQALGSSSSGGHSQI